MNSNDNILPESVRQVPAMFAFEETTKELLRRNGMELLITRFFDTMNAQKLPFFAPLFDVEGLKGWVFAATTDQQRALLKKAILLHRYKGTPWAIDQVIAQSAYPAAVLVENPQGNLGTIRITIDANTNTPNDAQLNALIQQVMIYKRGSTVFEGIFFTGLDFTDAMAIIETGLTINSDSLYNDTATTTGTFLYDGSVTYNGSRNYCNDLDTITISIHY